MKQITHSCKCYFCLHTKIKGKKLQITVLTDIDSSEVPMTFSSRKTDPNSLNTSCKSREKVCPYTFVRLINLTKAIRMVNKNMSLPNPGQRTLLSLMNTHTYIYRYINASSFKTNLNRQSDDN